MKVFLTTILVGLMVSLSSVNAAARGKRHVPCVAEHAKHHGGRKSRHASASHDVEARDTREDNYGGEDGSDQYGKGKRAPYNDGPQQDNVTSQSQKPPSTMLKPDLQPQVSTKSPDCSPSKPREPSAASHTPTQLNSPTSRPTKMPKGSLRPTPLQKPSFSTSPPADSPTKSASPPHNNPSADAGPSTTTFRPTPIKRPSCAPTTKLNGSSSPTLKPVEHTTIAPTTTAKATSSPTKRPTKPPNCAPTTNPEASKSPTWKSVKSPTNAPAPNSKGPSAATLKPAKNPTRDPTTNSIASSSPALKPVNSHTNAPTTKANASSAPTLTPPGVPSTIPHNFSPGPSQLKTPNAVPITTPSESTSPRPDAGTPTESPSTLISSPVEPKSTTVAPTFKPNGSAFPTLNTKSPSSPVLSPAASSPSPVEPTSKPNGSVSPRPDIEPPVFSPAGSTSTPVAPFHNPLPKSMKKTAAPMVPSLSSPSSISWSVPSKGPATESTGSSLPSSIATPLTPSVSTPVDPATSPSRPSAARECSLNADGSFGSVGHSEIVIRFSYELETDISTDVRSTIPALERAFNSAILPELFTKMCVPPHGKAGSRRLATTGLAKGISTKPHDRVVQSPVCGQESDDSHTCRVVQGGLTVYVDDGTDEVQTPIIRILQVGMENNFFLSAHEGIKRVTYLDATPERNAVTGTDKSPTAAPPSRPNLNILWGVLAALAAIILAILAVVIWRRKQDHDDSDEPSPNERSVSDDLADLDADANANVVTNDDVEAIADSEAVIEKVDVEG